MGAEYGSSPSFFKKFRVNLLNQTITERRKTIKKLTFSIKLQKTQIRKKTKKTKGIGCFPCLPSMETSVTFEISWKSSLLIYFSEANKIKDFL